MHHRSLAEFLAGRPTSYRYTLCMASGPSCHRLSGVRGNSDPVASPTPPRSYAPSARKRMSSHMAPCSRVMRDEVPSLDASGSGPRSSRGSDGCSQRPATGGPTDLTRQASPALRQRLPRAPSQPLTRSAPPTAAENVWGRPATTITLRERHQIVAGPVGVGLSQESGVIALRPLPVPRYFATRPFSNSGRRCSPPVPDGHTA